MRQEDLEYLRCPACSSHLQVDRFRSNGTVVFEGVLRCERDHCYPVIDAIPRFTPEVLAEHPSFFSEYGGCFATPPRRQDRVWRRTSESFARQWLTYDVIEADEDRATFFAKTGFAADELCGALVLDAGCGSGRYARIAAAAGARVVAVDLSRACERAAQVLSPFANALVVQANLMSLPFRRDLFDAVYSIGVLHHTPDTRKALEAVAQFVRPGGKLAVWLYARRDPVFEAANRVLRGITTRLPFATLMRLAKLAIPVGAMKRALLARKPTAWMSKLLPPCSSHPDPHIRVCDTFDWYSPEFQWHHTDDEVQGWLRDLGFAKIRSLSAEYEPYYTGQGHGVNFVAEKPA